jgi:zinc transport system substrate-binding protein
MKKLITLILILVFGLSLSGCDLRKDYDIVTTLFPQYDFAKQIVQDKLTVGLIIPPGVEAHGFEPTTGNIITINNAKLFIYTSEIMEPWASTVMQPNSTAVVLNLSLHLDIDADLHDHEHTSLALSQNKSSSSLRLSSDDHDHDHENDPHYWVDLVMALQMIDEILEHIIEIDPDNADFYIENAEEYYHILYDLHEEIEAYMESIPSEKREIFHAGHVNLGFFASRYNLTVHSLTEEYAPDGNPTSSQISAMIEEIKASGAKYIFYEELVEPRVATTIKNELAVQQYQVNLLLFHGLHNVSATYLKNNKTYFEIMTNNFTNLKIVLDEFVINPIS